LCGGGHALSNTKDIHTDDDDDDDNNNVYYKNSYIKFTKAVKILYLMPVGCS